MFLSTVTFFGIVITLNLLLAGATGNLYEFWYGRRGSARLFATITLPSIRLALSFLGLVFLLATLYFDRRSLIDFLMFR